MDNTRGMSFVDVVVGSAIALIVFMGLFAAFKLSLELYSLNKARDGAVALANERIERIRSMAYDSVGTVAGIPSGTLPQNETVTYGGVPYALRTLIQYVDDPADGTDAADTLTADYKRVKIEVSWPTRAATSTVSFVTNVVPPGEESLVGAGVLRVLVRDATTPVPLPLAGASVHIINTTIATSVDVTTLSNTSGTVSFPGAWAGTGYQVVVSKAGYSSAQTYTATTSNPNPSPSPATVAAGNTTELIFQIDRLASLTVATHAPAPRVSFDDVFADASGLVSFVNTVVGGSALSLDNTSGSYPSSGTAESVDIGSASLTHWLSLSFTDNKPAGTDVHYTVLYDTGSGFAPIPASDLPGNDVGFTSSPVDLTGLSITTYSHLRIKATLTTSDSTQTPSVAAWHLSYITNPAAVANVPFHIYGTKTIGADSGGASIYKYDQNFSTNGSGSHLIDQLEWDRYNIALTTALIVAGTCPGNPVDVTPNSATNVAFSLAPSTANALRVTVRSSLGGFVPYAEVRAHSAGYDTTVASDECGIAYFSGIPADTYTLDVTHGGFQASSISTAVSGITDAYVTLSP